MCFAQCLWHVFIFQNGESFRKWDFHVVSLSFVSSRGKAGNAQQNSSIVITPWRFLQGSHLFDSKLVQYKIIDITKKQVNKFFRADKLRYNLPIIVAPQRNVPERYVAHTQYVVLCRTSPNTRRCLWDVLCVPFLETLMFGMFYLILTTENLVFENGIYLFFRQKQSCSSY